MLSQIVKNVILVDRLLTGRRENNARPVSHIERGQHRGGEKTLPSEGVSVAGKSLEYRESKHRRARRSRLRKSKRLISMIREPGTRTKSARTNARNATEQGT